MSVSCKAKRPDNVPDSATYINKGGYAWHFCERSNDTLHDFPLYQCTRYNGDGSIYNSGTFLELAQQNLSSDHKLNQFPAYGDWWKGKRLHLGYKFRENRLFDGKDGDSVITELRGYQLLFMSESCLRATKIKDSKDLNIRDLTDDNLPEVVKRAPSLFREKIEEQISNIPRHADVNIQESGCWMILNFRVKG